MPSVKKTTKTTTSATDFAVGLSAQDRAILEEQMDRAAQKEGLDLLAGAVASVKASEIAESAVEDIVAIPVKPEPTKEERLHTMLEGMLGTDAALAIAEAVKPKEHIDLSFNDYIGYKAADQKLQDHLATLRKMPEHSLSMAWERAHSTDTPTQFKIEKMRERILAEEQPAALMELVAYACTVQTKTARQYYMTHAQEGIRRRAEHLDTLAEQRFENIMHMLRPLYCMLDLPMYSGDIQRLVRHIKKSKEDLLDLDFLRIQDVLPQLQTMRAPWNDPKAAKLSKAILATKGRTLQEHIQDASSTAITDGAVSMMLPHANAMNGNEMERHIKVYFYRDADEVLHTKFMLITQLPSVEYNSSVGIDTAEQESKQDITIEASTLLMALLD